MTFARSFGFSDFVLDDIETAVGEALANAVEHGASEDPWFTVEANFVGGSLVVDIKDGGRGFDTDSEAARIAAQRALHRGFGITLMRTLMDRVEYAEGGTRIRLFKRRPDAGHLDQKTAGQSEA
jgi:anti-sigma regulatory factor (Ser/Thr protein kinase)